MDPKNFFAELKRRNVYKVAVAYAVVGWLIIQIATSTFPVLQIPGWTIRLVVVLVLLGFPLALVLAWAFELTPEGIRRSTDSAHPAPRPLRAASIIMLLAAAAIAMWLFTGRPFPFQKAPPFTGTTDRQNVGDAAKSIAVLPFASLSEDKANAYFAEGIQDEILTRLARIRDLKVISRTSTLRYKSAPENLPEIAKQLGVAHILEGSVQKSGDQVRINVQLINAQTDSHLWAETFDRKLTDIFAVESEVAQRVADSLKATLTGVEKAALGTRPTENQAAYDAYLRGLALVASNRETASAFTDAANFFEEAARLDPKFTLAWARASVAHSRIYWVGYDRTDDRAERAKKAAEKARALQSELGETFLARGYYEYLVTREYDAAWLAFKEALARLPNNSEALVALSFIERRKGKWPEAVAHQEQAAQRDPQNLPVLSQLGVTYFALKRFADAHALVDRLLALAPENPQVLAGLARLCLAEGNLEGAETALRPVSPAPNNDYVFEIQVRLALIARRDDDATRLLEAALAQGPSTLGVFVGKYRYLLGFAKELAGDSAGARSVYEVASQELEQLLQAQPNSQDAAMYLGFVQAALGQKEAALAAAQKAIDLRPASVDAVAGPGFEEALARIKAQFGQTDAALLELRRLLKLNYLGPEQIPLTPALLRLDPVWNPLRQDPRFQELCRGKQP
ncbi:MAG TPA: tetratricopeptide repeat protein [Chthoniobacterales bacterium]|nr:tetratricopeptide repeat protein [Chthoniobacterales bacterium]